MKTFFFKENGELVSYGCHSRSPQTATQNNRNLPSQGSGGEKSKIKVLAIPGAPQSLQGSLLPGFL